MRRVTTNRIELALALQVARMNDCGFPLVADIGRACLARCVRVRQVLVVGDRSRLSIDIVLLGRQIKRDLYDPMIDVATEPERGQ